MDSKEDKKGGRIAYVVGSLESGGIERSVTEWALYLKEKTNWQPVVICILRRSGNFLDTLVAHGIEVHECKLKNEGLTPFIFRMAKLLRSTRSDVVHSQVAFSLLWQTIAFIIGGVRRIIFTQQNEYRNWNGFSAKWRLKFYYHLSKFFIDHYTCVSPSVRSNISSLVGVPDQRFKVIHNAVNTDIFFPRPQRRKAAREKMGLADRDFAIGMVASFSEQKGHRYIFETCASLITAVPNFKLILIGNGNFFEQQKSAEKLNIAGQTKFLGNRKDIDELLQGLDCFVLPSLWEGLPLALLEAMACQIPVIGSDINGINAVVQNEESGLLVPPANPVALKQAIIRFFKNPEFAARLAINGRNLVIEKFSLRQTIDNYIKLYS